MSRCPECRAEYSPNGGGHCRGGAYGGCCKTFSSDAAADAHFLWVDGSVRCRTTEEMLAMRMSFRETSKGWTNAKARPLWWQEGAPNAQIVDGIPDPSPSTGATLASPNRADSAAV